MMRMLPSYIPSPPRGVWYLGPLPVRAYAVCVITGIIVALLIGDRRLTARGGERGMTYDIALWAVPFGLIGGRLYHLATDWRTYFGDGGAGLAAALRIWDGGLGIWGAVTLGVMGAWIGCRRCGIPLPVLLDAVAPGVVLAQAIGRLGNYFNQELYGRETTMPWGLEIFYRRDPSGFDVPNSLDGVSTGQVAFVVQPTFLYELIWNVLVFVALIYIDRRFIIGHGRLFGFYVAFYCAGRFCVELLRDDPATLIAGIRINSFTSTFVFIGAVVYIILAPKGREAPGALRGSEYVVDEALEREPAELAAAAVASAASAVGPVGPGEPNQPDDVAEAVKAEVAEVTDEVAAESVVQVADRDGESTPAVEETSEADIEREQPGDLAARRQPRTRSTPKLHRPRPRSRQRWLRRHTTKPSPRCPRRRRPSPIRPSRMNWRSPDLGTTLLSRTAFDGKTISARDAAVGGGFDGVDNDDPRRHCLVAGAGLNRPPIGRPLPQPERCADEVPGHKMATGWNGNQPNPDALTSQTTKPSRLASPAGSIFFRNPDAHATPGRCLRCPTAT